MDIVDISIILNTWKGKRMRKWYLAALMLAVTSPLWCSADEIAPKIEGKIIYADAKVQVSGNGSKDKPFKTLNEAVKAADADTTVVLRGGTYYETVYLHSRQRVKMIAAQPGETVVLSGMKKISGWKKDASREGVYTAEIDFIPKRLFVGMIEQNMARLPRSGWFQSSTADVKTGLVCDELKKLEFDLASTQSFIWLQRGNTFGTFDLMSVDLKAGNFTITPGRWTRLTNGDKFYLQNNPDFISSPGEWAFVKTGDGNKAKIYFRPENEKQLGDVAIPFTNGSIISAVRGTKDFTLYGVDVVGSNADGIAVGGENITIVNCRIYFNGRHGIAARNNTGLNIIGNQVWCNGNLGVMMHSNKDCEVKYNEIALNYVDGLVLSWNSSDIEVKGNYIHHHLFWGHPDNIQLYRNVTNVKFEDNLLLAGGQGVMMEQCSDLEFKNNIVAGTDAAMLIFGHGNADKAKLEGNTLAFSGYTTISLSGKDYQIDENIIVPGHNKPGISASSGLVFKGDENLFWNAGTSRNMVVAVAKKFYSTLDSYVKDTGNDKQSIYADPKFISAPNSSAVLNAKKLSQCTNAKLFYRGNGVGFKKGDTVELNFDGIKRTVTEAGSDYIVINPALKNAPIKCWIVLNWGNAKDINLDLRPAKDSPAMKNGKQEIGSNIDIAAYRRGEFKMDGKRLCPEVPSYVSDRLKLYQ